MGTGAQMLANGQNVNSRVTGVTDVYASVRNTTVADGDWISKAQVDGRSSVVVLGAAWPPNSSPSPNRSGRTCA